MQIELAFHHQQLGENSTAWFWCHSALMCIKQQTNLFDLNFIEFERTPSVFAVEKSLLITPVEQAPDSTMSLFASATGSVEDVEPEEQDFGDIIGYHAVPVAAKLNLSEIKIFGFYLTEQSIDVRVCASLAHMSLCRPAMSLHHPSYRPARVFFETCVLACLVKLNYSHCRPIDHILRHAAHIDVEGNLPTDAISKCVGEYEVSFHTVNSDPEIKHTELELSNVTFTYSKFLQSNLGLYEASSHKLVLQVCDAYLSASIKLLQNTGSASERETLQAYVADQLQRRGGPLKVNASILSMKRPQSLQQPRSPTSPSGKLSISERLEREASQRDTGEPEVAKTRPSGPVVWMHDSLAPDCTLCLITFGFFTRRHHCRTCGRVACASCCKMRLFSDGTEQRMCSKCAELPSPPQ